MTENLPTVDAWRKALAKAENRFMAIAEKQDNGLVFQTEGMFALQKLKESKALRECRPDTIYDAIINVASIGLSLNPATSHAYLVPRNGKACLDISYRGLTEIATKSGAVVYAKAVLVHERDDFQFEGVHQMPHHKFDPFSEERGQIIGGYCVAKLPDGSFLIDTMTIREIYKVRDTSKAKNGPWKDWPEEMMKKTLIKRASKTWPHNSMMQMASSIINEHEGIDTDIRDTPEDGEQVITSLQEKELEDMLAESGVRRERVLKAFGISSFAQLPVERFDECRNRLADAALAREEREAESAARN